METKTNITIRYKLTSANEIEFANNVTKADEIEVLYSSVQSQNIKKCVFNISLIAHRSPGWQAFVKNIINAIANCADKYRQCEFGLNVNLPKASFQINNIADQLRSIYECWQKYKDYNYGVALGDIKFVLFPESNIVLSENFDVSWCKVYDEIYELITTTEMGRRICNKYRSNLFKGMLKFKVMLNVDMSDCDVTALRHLFPLRKVLDQLEIGIKLVLSSDDEKDGERARQFFYFASKDFLEIYNTKVVRNDVDASDVLPILLATNYNGSVKFKRESLEKSIGVYKAYIENPNKYKGTTEDQIKEPEKNELCKALVDKLKEYEFGSEDYMLFRKLLFLYIVRNMIGDKSIITNYAQHNKKSEQTRHCINDDLIDLTYHNVKSYAEGLWQIIENAVLHSQGHMAYFGIRYYNADTNASMSNISKATANRFRLWRRYIPEDSRKSGSKNIFNEKTSDGTLRYKNFIEFFVIDDAVDTSQFKPVGIIDNIKNETTNGINEEIRKDIKEIGEIFELTEDCYREKEQYRYYTAHYGMRWFKSHINKLNGIFTVTSPWHDSQNNVQMAQKYNSFTNVTDISAQHVYYTEYSSLMPIDNRKMRLDKVDFPLSERGSLFLPINAVKEIVFGDADAATNGAQPMINAIDIDFSKLDVSQKNGEHSKTYIVESLYENQLKNKIIINRLNVISLRKTDKNRVHENIETFAKALIQFLFMTAVEDREEKTRAERAGRDTVKRIIVAVMLDNDNDAREFVRLFSVFYDKLGNQEYMRNVQIAVCIRNNGSPEVGFILGGEKLQSAYETASNFLYYSVDTLKFIPLLKFFSNKRVAGKKEGDKKSDGEGLFPFDLFLCAPDGADADNYSQRKSCFIEKMQRYVNTDYRIQNKIGCKIGGVYVRLGSKIRVDTFCEAEYLLHNLYAVKLFAYAIALDIIYRHPELHRPKRLFVLGYETYSSVLIQETADILQEYYANIKVDWGIETRTEDYPVYTFDKFKEAEKNEIANSDIVCITISPVATTMSTVYKLHAAFRRGIQVLNRNAKIDFSDNYCLVAVGDAYVKDIDESDYERETVKRFLQFQPNGQSIKKEIDSKSTYYAVWTTVTLQKENSDDNGECRVKYALALNAHWYNECHKSKEPLLRVNRTSTQPEVLFTTPPSDDVLEYYNLQRSEAKK